MLAWVALAAVAAGGAVAYVTAKAPMATAGNPGQSQSTGGGAALLPDTAPPPQPVPPRSVAAIISPGTTWPGGVVHVAWPSGSHLIHPTTIRVGGVFSSLAPWRESDPPGWRVRIPAGLSLGSHELELRFGAGTIKVTPSGSALQEGNVTVLRGRVVVAPPPMPTISPATAPLVVPTATTTATIQPLVTARLSASTALSPAPVPAPTTTTPTTFPFARK